MSFGETVKKLREEKKMSQQDVAALIPMNQSNYSKIERGAQEPDLFQLKRLCIIFDVSSDELLGLAPENPSAAKDIAFAKKVAELYKNTYLK